MFILILFIMAGLATGNEKTVLVNDIPQGKVLFTDGIDGKNYFASSLFPYGKSYPSKFFKTEKQAEAYIVSKCKNEKSLNRKNVLGY